MHILIFVLGMVTGLFINKCICKIPEGQAISIRFPILELLNAIFYLLIYYKYGLTLNTAFYCFITSVLLIICIIDYYRQIIPDELVILMLVATVIYKAALYFIYKTPLILLDSLYGFLFGGILFLFIAVVSKGAMGGGDVKLVAVLGIIFGLKNTVLTILSAFIIGATVSLYLLISGKKGRKDAIPFGPFIGIAFIITLLTAVL
ncbi:MAG: A24 family peptidase [Clostridiaceae bacterium]|nr:A24 family peptidase [Clostridiaceae bacterium]